MTPPSPPDVAAEVADDVRSIEHALNRLRPDAYHPMFAPVLRRLIARLRAQDAAVREAVAAERERCQAIVDAAGLLARDDDATHSDPVARALVSISTLRR